MIPTRVGQKCEGGYFTGVIRIGSTCYAIIVAPKSTQVTGLPFKTSVDATANTQSVNDGWTNTNSMNNSSHPVAQYCRNIASGGYTDWYLPSRNELALCYRYLKPTTDNNATGLTRMLGNGTPTCGENPNSVPAGVANTTTNPAQTTVTTFQSGSVAAFDTDTYYWTSTEYSSYTSRTLVHHFNLGRQPTSGKTITGNKVRAVRRVAI